MAGPITGIDEYSIYLRLGLGFMRARGELERIGGKDRQDETNAEYGKQFPVVDSTDIEDALEWPKEHE